jgi:hypothetical protein
VLTLGEGKDAKACAKEHRTRLPARYRQSSEAALQDYKLLELLLVFANECSDATDAEHGSLGSAGSPYGKALKIHHWMVEYLPR